jgi:hypothetical protein
MFAWVQSMDMVQDIMTEHTYQSSDYNTRVLQIMILQACILLFRCNYNVHITL